MPFRYLFFLAVLLMGASTATFAAQDGGKEKDKDKDKTPPVITELRAESITETSVVIMWTTDEPADSGLRYGIDPKTNKKGPDDATLVLSHAIALAELLPQTTYAFCAESRDAANNKSESCGTFTTLGEEPPPPPPPTSTSTGGSTKVKRQVTITGFAYPHAQIALSIKPFLAFGETVERYITAQPDGSFSIDVTDPPRGFSTYYLSAEDTDGVASVRKGVQFKYGGGDTPLFKQPIVMPPTVTLEREVIGRGDDIVVSGSAPRNTGVLVEIGGVAYETKSDKTGTYRLQINSARLTSGKESVRARSSMISDFGYDYSFSKVVTVSDTTVPEADLNADGMVDIKDFSSFLAHPTDMNKDGNINAADVSIFLRAFKIYMP